MTDREDQADDWSGMQQPRDPGRATHEQKPPDIDPEVVAALDELAIFPEVRELYKDILHDRVAPRLLRSLRTVLDWYNSKFEKEKADQAAEEAAERGSGL